ncbi:MAG: peptide chain release factor N(5)-glutamine methyltransferase [Treponema sp.]|nr:peptide chain release factor N(5)-glutamine methyltransferase [Treponema sp.]
MTIQNFKNTAIKKIASSPSPQLDLEVLLSYILGFTKTDLLMKRDFEIPREKEVWLQEALERRAQGLPIAYITGQKEFYGYNFIVSPDVLIPKPDTEILVERATDLIAQIIEKKKNSLLTICDMCTGSGCIALSVMKSLLEDYNIPQDRLPKFTLADISEAALDIARKNAEGLFGKASPLVKSRLAFVRTNLFETIPAKFDLILTNPPYVPRQLTDQLLQDGRSEPRLALDGDVTITGEHSSSNDGMEIIRNLIPQAKEHLAPHGTIFMETGEYNAQDSANLAKKYGFTSRIHKDLEGQLRLVEMTC